jgi:HEAT repeat protein
VVSDPEDRQTLLDLAVFEHPDDFDLLRAAIGSQGRRMRHTAATALGLGGDPRGYDLLLPVLVAIDVDPAHGFTGRATAATALGWLGLPRAGRVLVRAMRDEALDHEGRPGAGLGIQRPVRASMLAALGEIGAPEWADLIAGYLGNTSGSAHGGFYLQAMDALIKLGAGDVARAYLSGPEVVAANALGVLAGLGQSDLVATFRSDPRPVVAAVAAAALEVD